MNADNQEWEVSFRRAFQGDKRKEFQLEYSCCQILFA